MNILAITQIYPQLDDVGDDRPTSTVEYFGREWVKQGHNVMVIHCPSKFPVVFYLLPASIKDKFSNKSNTTAPPIESRRVLHRTEQGLRIHRLPMLKVYPGRAFSESKMKRQAKKIWELVDSEGFKPDLVVGHFANPSLELVANVAEHYGVKSSMVFHHDCSPRNIEKYRIKEIIPRIGAVGARSRIEAQEIQERLGLKETPFICYSGAPNDAVEACEKECKKHDYSKGTHHLYVGSMLTRKHVDAIIRAFAEEYKGDRKATLRIVGGGQEEENLKKLVSELGLTDSITFVGKIPRADVMEEMHQAQVFTMISHGETFGMVYIEAMLQGCITIASYGEGFDGIIQDGVNGFLCKAGDAEMLKSIYEKIEAMSVDERNRIGQNAIDTALGFSEAAVAERYLKDALAQRNAR